MTPYPYLLAASGLLLNARTLPSGDMLYKVRKKYYSFEGGKGGWGGEEKNLLKKLCNGSIP